MQLFSLTTFYLLLWLWTGCICVSGTWQTSHWFPFWNQAQWLSFLRDHSLQGYKDQLWGHEQDLWKVELSQGKTSALYQFVVTTIIILCWMLKTDLRRSTLETAVESSDSSTKLFQGLNIWIPLRLVFSSCCQLGKRNNDVSGNPRSP